MKTEPRTPEQAEWLQHYESALAESSAVIGFIVLDDRGGVLAEKTRDLPMAHGVDEAAIWLQNAFHAVDSYYPEAKELFLRYRDYNVILARGHDLIAAAVLDPSYELKHFDDLLSGERLKRLASRLRTGGPAKRSETVFLKISEDQTSNPPMSVNTGTAAPMSASPAASTPEAPAAKGTPVGLIGGIAAGMLIVGTGIAYFLLQPKNEAPAPVTPAPVAEPAIDYATEATRLQAQANELTQLARELSEGRPELADLMATGFSASQSARAAQEANQPEAAYHAWTDARNAYGQAALRAARAQYEDAKKGLIVAQPQNYAKTTWAEIEAKLLQAQRAEEAVDYRTAIRHVREATMQVSALPNQLRQEIRRLAAEAVLAKDLTTAAVFYRDLLRLEPANAEASAFIYRHAAEPGTLITNRVGMKLALVPAGSFTMGSPSTEERRDDDEMLHRVSLTQPFFMATTEVTQAQWQAVMGTPFTAPDANPAFIGAELPVHSISWAQANEFCQRLSALEGRTYRLPTEAEWEFAARAGSTTAYTFGNSLTDSQAQVYQADGKQVDAPAKVGSFAPNAWGLYDLHGNVWEWTADWYGPYGSQAAEDPKGASEDSFSRIDLAVKALRGGSWYDEADKARSANRLGSSPVAGLNYLGFRVVADLPPYPPSPASVP